MSIKVSHIVATSLNHVIGKDNKIPWHLPEDLKFFKATTLDAVIIMGRKTFESLPGLLKRRTHFVVSRDKTLKPKSGETYFNSIESAIEAAKALEVSKEKKEIFIIGGGEIYKQSFDLIDQIYLTQIHKEFEGDVFYPQIPEKFKLTQESEIFEDKNLKFQFCRYT